MDKIRSVKTTAKDSLRTTLVTIVSLSDYTVINKDILRVGQFPNFVRLLGLRKVGQHQTIQWEMDWPKGSTLP